MERITKSGYKFNLLNVLQGLNRYADVDEILNRLASYEDTELEPEEINEALRAQQERESPKPLTLKKGFDITNADGTPIDYDALGKKYKDQLCYCDIDEFYIGEDGQLVLMDDCGSAVWVDRGDYHITIHEPEGSEDDG